MVVAFERSASMIVDDVSNVKGRRDERRLKKSEKRVALHGWLKERLQAVERVEVEVMRAHEFAGLILVSGVPSEAY